MSLMAELQRRKVFKVAAGYAVVGWLVIQVATSVLPLYDTPAWFLRAFVLIVSLGFPIALVMAWMLEVTPEGIKADVPTAGSKRMFAIAGVLALLALGWYFRADLPGARAPAGQLRLAVLPIENFSPDPDNAFYADGLHDDILTSLSRLHGVEVISRTTMQTFKDSKLTLAEIANKLNATQVLEGSVRRDADHVRLTVQLIDASKDDHMWAETYDRPLKDALSLQNEVAQGVARALKLSPKTGADSGAMTNIPAAYDLYLKARLKIDPDARYKLLDSALVLDPAFTQARAERAIAACQRIWTDESLALQLAPQVRADIARVRREAPGATLADVAQAFYLYYVERDYRAALVQVDKALAIEPNDIRGLEAKANLLRRLGHGPEAIVVARRALALDPDNPYSHEHLGEMLDFYGDTDGARAVFDAAIARLPEDQTTRIRNFETLMRFASDGVPMTRAQAEARSQADATGPIDDFGIIQLGIVDEAPSPERLARMAASPRDWCGSDPCALNTALEAQYLGDRKRFDAALEEAARLYGSRDQAALKSPTTRGLHALFLALSGDGAGARAEIESTLAWIRAHDDHADMTWFRETAALGFAAAGDHRRAMDMVEARTGNAYYDMFIYYDHYLQRYLRDEPRYQDWRKRIEAGWVKP